MSNLVNKKIDTVSMLIEFVILLVSVFTFLYWFRGEGLFYSDNEPVLSIFTSISLALLMIPRLARRFTETWSQPMSLAFIGIVLSGNLTSLFILLSIPDLFFLSLENLVPTSAITASGLILFCFYEILIVIRKTPNSAFVLDDILLHLALFPGALSLLGHISGVETYISFGIDPRVGVSYLEMFLMTSYVAVAFLTNPDLFLWRFVSRNPKNQIIFAILFVNQYVVAFVFGLFFRPETLPTNQVGLEFYILLAGVLATLAFLSFHAFDKDVAKKSI